MFIFGRSCPFFFCLKTNVLVFYNRCYDRLLRYGPLCGAICAAISWTCLWLWPPWLRRELPTCCGAFSSCFAPLLPSPRELVSPVGEIQLVICFCCSEPFQIFTFRLVFDLNDRQKWSNFTSSWLLISKPIDSIVFSKRLRGTTLSGLARLGVRRVVLFNRDSNMPSLRVSRILIEKICLFQNKKF